MQLIWGMKRLGLGFAVLLTLHGCDSDKKKASCEAKANCAADGGSDAGNAVEEGGTADGGPRQAITGRVFDANDALALAGVALSLASERDASDQRGAFSLASAAKVKASTLEAKNEDYVPAKYRVPGAGGYLEVFLKKVDERVSFRGDQGVSVRLPSGAGIDIPAGAVEDRQGARVNGLVTLELAEIDGRVRTQAAALPGDGHARLLDQTVGIASLERALSIRILDDTESELTVNKIADVVARLPSARADASFTQKTYSFDDATGEWVEEGSASQLTREGVRAYQVDVEHLSWWAVGRFFEASTCIRACVEDAGGNALQGAQVWIVGASHAGVSTFFTDGSGCGASDVVAGADVVLVAQYLNAVSDASKVATGNAVASVGKDAGACKDVGTLKLKTGSVQTCPQGFSACGTGCFDLASEARHCGDCGTVCGAGETCVLNACQAPVPNKIAVRGRYADRFGSPWPMVAVQIGNVTKMTDANGAFAFDDVSLPYDLKILRGDPEVYLGLTRPNPELRDSILSGSSGTVRGVVSGGVGFPLPADHELNVTFIGASAIGFNVIRKAGQNGSWGPQTLQWSPTLAALTGTVFAVQHNELTGAVTGLGTAPVLLTNGGALMSPTLDIVLSPVTLHPVNFNVVLPPGAGFENYDLSIGLFSRIVSSPATNTFSLDVPDQLPDVAPARFIVRSRLGNDTMEAVRYFGAAVRKVNVDLPMAATCVAPDDGAVDVPRTARLEFKPQAGTATLLIINWVQGTRGVSASLYTKESSLSFARLSVLGITPVPDDGTLYWTPYGSGPAGDLDEMLDPARPPVSDTLSSGTTGRSLSFAP